MKTKIALQMLFATTIVICADLSYGSALDATLYTTYGLNTTGTNVSWTVCGSTQNTSGCYGAGNLGPFGKVGALLEGNPKTDLTTNTVTRAIYVVDIASGSNFNEVVLYAYTKKDAITPDFDTVTVSLSKTVSLPLVGGTSAAASMAANTRFLFIGTNQSEAAVELDKRKFTISQVSAFSGINVTSITADQYGYVTITSGTNGGFSGFLVIGPDGTGREDGGGSQFMLNTVQALLPSTLP
jgi:hypothetical protein